MKIKLILLIFLLSSCGSLEDAGKAMRNEKIRTTDEFLIEKRGPLSQPPKMDELPKPKTSSNNKNDDESILRTEDKKSGEKSKIENILLEEIRKN